MGILGRMIVDEPANNPIGLVIGLPGRGLPLSEMYRFMLHTGLDRSVVAVIEPRNLEWYPQPFGINDQEESVIGCKAAVKPIKERIKHLARIYKIPYNKIAVVGYSAGAVMALEIAQNCKKELAMFVSIAGTILDPKRIPPAKNNTPILMKHCQDDECFDWYERHEPARS